MADVLIRSVNAEGKEIFYCLEYKKVKNLNLRVCKDGSIRVSANKQVPVSDIDAFVARKVSFIQNAVDRFLEIEQHRPQAKQYVSGETFYIQGRSVRLQVSSSDKDSVSSDGVYIYLKMKNTDDLEKRKWMVKRYLDNQCKAVYKEVLDDLFPLFQKYGVSMPQLRIRDMETRWGSCLAKKGIITLNKKLIEAPRDCIEYVVMHEFCHFIHPNHSKQFYAFLSMLMPDWKERKKNLDKNADYWL